MAVPLLDYAVRDERNSKRRESESSAQWGRSALHWMRNERATGAGHKEKSIIATGRSDMNVARRATARA